MITEQERTSLIAAEQFTLGGLLINPAAAADVLEIVGPGDFLLPNHNKIVESMISVATEGAHIDPVSVGEALAKSGNFDQIAYLLEMADQTPSASNVREYARVVADHAHRRALIGILDEASKSIYAAPIRPIPDLINETQSLIGKIEKDRDQGAGLQPIDQALKDWLTGLQEIESGVEIPRIYTGLSNIDERWDGMRPSELIIMGGTKGTGKTALAMQIAGQSAVEGKHVLVFSLEMPARQIAMRVSGALGRIPVWMAESKKPEVRAQFYELHSTALAMATTKLKGCPLQIDDQGGTHVNNLMGRARRAHRKKPVDLVVVDYLQLVTGDGSNREQIVAQISRSLKALAKELDCPVLALSQLNRQGIARESDGIENDADIVIKLHREDVEGQETLNPGLCEARTTKLRRGQVGVDLLRANLAHYRLDVWSAPVHEPKPEPKYRQFSG